MYLTPMLQTPNPDIGAASRADLATKGGADKNPAQPTQSAQPATAGQATAQQMAERRTRALADMLEEAIRSSRAPRSRSSR